MTLRIGSLFTGYGGLDMATRMALGGEVVWYSDIAKGPIAINTHHHPTIPNIGDIRTADWSQVPPVDVLVGGFPCKDLSHAGKRAGLQPDTHSGLWNLMAYAIANLRPRLVIAENVRGLLSAEAHSDMEPCPICVGDRGDVTALRALGAVLGDLAELGYDARWHGIRAGDVGAPHSRFRVFILAYPIGERPGDVARDASRQRHGRGQDTGVVAGLVRGGEGEARQRERARSVPLDPAAGAERGGHASADAEGAGQERGGAPRHRRPGPADRGDRTGPAADADRVGAEGRRAQRLEDAAAAGGHPADQRAAGAPGDAEGVEQRERVHGDLQQPGDGPAGDRPGPEVAWGKYEQAIRRWQRVLGRPAPPPTITLPGKTPRISPRFTEWMMGLPDGHVCDVPGLSRAQQLEACGRGVVPLQAATAIARMLREPR